jgi:hypothetical protein
LLSYRNVLKTSFDPILKKPSVVHWIAEGKYQKKFSKQVPNLPTFVLCWLRGRNIPQKGGIKMQRHANQTDSKSRDNNVNEELADVLTAISVVSKRLAKKLTALSEQDHQETKGGKDDE